MNIIFKMMEGTFMLYKRTLQQLNKHVSAIITSKYTLYIYCIVYAQPFEVVVMAPTLKGTCVTEVRLNLIIILFYLLQRQ